MKLKLNIFLIDPTAGTVVLVVFLGLLLDHFVLIVVAHLMLLLLLILAILDGSKDRSKEKE